MDLKNLSNYLKKILEKIFYSFGMRNHKQVVKPTSHEGKY